MRPWFASPLCPSLQLSTCAAGVRHSERSLHHPALLTLVQWTSLIAAVNQSCCPPHHGLCPPDLLQASESTNSTSWLTLPLPHLFCQPCHAWPSAATPTPRSELRTCRAGPQATTLGSAQNKRNCHNSQENKRRRFSA